MQLELESRTVQVEPMDETGHYRVLEWSTKQELGCVYKHRGFSYRGKQGWNRGVRLRDFHPTEWIAIGVGLESPPQRTRKDAVAWLVRQTKGRAT